MKLLKNIFPKNIIDYFIKCLDTMCHIKSFIGTIHNGKIHVKVITLISNLFIL